MRGNVMPKETFFNLQEEKQKRILGCIFDEFSEHPYEEASISRVVKNAGIAKGSFYQYFEDKMDMYLYIIQLIADMKLKYLEKIEVKLENVDFFEYFRGLYYGGFRFANSHPKISKIGMFLMRSNSDELKRTVVETNYQLAIEFYTKLIERGISEGAIRSDINKELLANLFIHMPTNVVDFFFKKYESGSYNDKELKEMIEEMIDILKYGIGNPS